MNKVMEMHLHCTNVNIINENNEKQAKGEQSPASAFICTVNTQELYPPHKQVLY